MLTHLKHEDDLVLYLNYGVQAMRRWHAFFQCFSASQETIWERTKMAQNVLYCSPINKVVFWFASLSSGCWSHPFLFCEMVVPSLGAEWSQVVVIVRSFRVQIVQCVHEYHGVLLLHALIQIVLHFFMDSENLEFCSVIDYKSSKS